METKEERYRNLVINCKKYNRSNGNSSNKKVIFKDYDKCNEINLWTYWQGKGNIDSTKILLVGQDWGCPTDELNIYSVKNVERIENGEDIHYLSKENKSITDKNLVELFYELGYNIDKTSKEESKNKELFFTNLITGYREKGTSGNVGMSYVDKKCKEHFLELVSILEPDIILCLGKLTYKGVINAFGIKERIGNYNEYIDTKLYKQKPLSITVNSKEIVLFPLAHCGAMGTLNRARKKGTVLTMEKGIKKQKEDWKRIKEIYDEINCKIK